MPGLPRMDRTVVKRTTLDQQGKDAGMPHATPVQCIQMVWPLTLTAWKFIEAAIAATAIIVTYNARDFAHTDLVKHGWDVMTPLEFTTLYDLEN